MTPIPLNGHTPTAEVQAIPITVVVPRDLAQVELVQVTARYRTQGGIQLGVRAVPFQLGIPAELAIQVFCQLAQAGVLHRVVSRREDGTVETEPVAAGGEYVLRQVPQVVRP